MADERIERQFHGQLNDANNAYQDVQRAVSDARKLIYLALKHEDAGGGFKAAAENWLENFGRDSMREAGRHG